MRYLLVFSLAFAVVCAAEVKTNPRDVIQCNSQAGDISLVEAEISDEGHAAGLVDIVFKYPPTGSPQNKEIHCIIVKDLRADQGSQAVILDGGVGKRNVTIHFTSQFRKSVDFSVSIMGQ